VLSCHSTLEAELLPANRTCQYNYIIENLYYKKLKKTNEMVINSSSCLKTTGLYSKSTLRLARPRVYRKLQVR
jgi:hypothetical protein